MPTIEPGDREEMLLAGILNGDESTNIEPATRKEMLLAGILNGDTECNIDPATREEALLKAILLNGGGGGSSKLPAVVDKSVTEITAKDLEGATKIGDYAFNKCLALTKFEIPSTITSIGMQSLSCGTGESNALTSITIPSSVISIGDYAFQNRSALKEIILTQGVTNLGQNAFYNTGIEEIEFPSSVAYISQSCCAACASLSSVTFLGDITKILANAFQNTALTTIDIPASVSQIGSKAFQGAPITSATIRATTPPSLSNANAFAGTEHIYVPAGSVDTYKAASNWSALATIIEAIPS